MSKRVKIQSNLNNYISFDVNSYSDYLPFGQVMPNRHSQQSYDFGFNGKIIDDELKGEFNSYDFGARILDPRIGRWLSRDPLAVNQPAWSPYKAMNDNPIFWVDPDGKTEYETVLISDEKTGKSVRMFVSKSNKSMTCGCVHTGNELPLSMKTQNYYDYAHVTKYTITTDGEVVISKYTEILYKNGPRHIENVTIDARVGNAAKYGEKYDPDDSFIQAGGFYMTSEKGEGTKYYSKDPQVVGNIDDLLGAMAGPESASAMKKTKTIDMEEVLETIKHFTETNEKAESLKKVGELFTPEDGDSAPKGNTQLTDTLYEADGGSTITDKETFNSRIKEPGAKKAHEIGKKLNKK